MIYFRTFGVAVIASIGILIALAMLLDRDTTPPAVDDLMLAVEGDSSGVEGAFVDGTYRLFAPRRPPVEWWFTYEEAIGGLADDCDGLNLPPDITRTTYADYSLRLRVEREAMTQGWFCYYIGIPAEFVDQFIEIQISQALHYLYPFQRIPGAVQRIGAIDHHVYGLGLSEFVASNGHGPFLNQHIWLFDYAQ